MKALIIVFFSIFCLKDGNCNLQDTLPQIQQKTIHKILKKERLSLKKCYEERVITTPLNSKQTIIVVPEIKKGSEEEGDCIINGRILVVNTKTGKVVSRYFEEEAWESNAIFIEKIRVKKSKESFSDKHLSFSVFFYKRNMSKPNPYYEVLINDFVIRPKKIDNVFNYIAYSNTGETDMKCYADMIFEEKELKMLPTKHNDFYDFQLKISIQETKFRENNNGDCEEKEGTILSTYEVYTYNGKQYERNKN